MVSDILKRIRFILFLSTVLKLSKAWVLVSLILYLIRFNTNNKRYFLNNGETKEF